MPPNESDPTVPKEPSQSEPMASGSDPGPPVEHADSPDSAEVEDRAAASGNGESRPLDGDQVADSPGQTEEEARSIPVEDDRAAPGQGQDQDEDEILMLDDDAIEELDDDDLVVEEEIASEPAPLPPAPPAMAVGMPPKPPTQPPPIAGADAQEPEPVSSEGDADESATPAAQAVAPGDPLDESIEVPTVLDRLIASQGADSAEEQAETLARELDESSSKERIGALAYELGELCERMLGDEARAVKAFGRALQADPSLRSNLWAIRRVFYRRKLWPNLVKLISAESRLAPDDAARADLLVEKAHILEDRMGDRDQAFAVYDEAVEADAQCMAALTGLERLALARGDQAQIERAWSLLAQAVETPARRQAYLLDLVRLLGERGGEEIEKARQYLVRAAELGGGGDAVARAREWLAEKSGEPAEMLDALDARATEMMARFGPAGPAASQAEDDDAREAHSEAEAVLRRQLVSLRRRQARMAAHQVGDADRAWSYLQQAMTLAPGDSLVVADLADLAERLGRYDELAELVEGWEAQADDPDQALRLSLRRATALFRAGQTASARALLATLAATQPPYLSILTLRENDALGSGDAQALAETYQSCAEAAKNGTGFGPGAASEPNGEVAAGYYLAAGDLYRTRVGDREKAIACFRQALEIAPGSAPAILSLAAAYESGRDFDRAIEHCQSQLERAGDGLAIHLLERLADLHQQVGDFEQQLGILEQLIVKQPDNLAHRWRHERLLERLGRRQERATALIELADKLSDPDARAATLTQAARCLDRGTADGERAVAVYRQLIELWPHDGYAREALADALRRTNQWQELASELRARATELEDDAAVRCLREAASIALDHLDQPELAAELLGELVDRSPTDGDALAMLGEARLRAGQADAALEALERETQVRDGAAGEAQSLCRYANLAESMGMTEQAEAAYRRALELQPESGLAAAGLLEMATRQGSSVSEADALAQLSTTAVARTLAADLCERAGWLLAASEDGDMTRAGELFERASSLDPSRRGALLGRVLVEARAGDPFAMGEALSALARTLGASYAAASLQLRAAVLAEVHGDESGHAERLRQAVAAAPTDPGTVIVGAEYLPVPGVQLAGDSKSFDEVAHQAALFGARADLASDPASRTDWQLGQAELLESLGRLNEALSIASNVLRQRDDDLRALQLLRRICLRGGDRAALARTSAQLARLIGDPTGKLTLLREAVAIFDGELGQADAAVPVYRRILAEDPGASEWQRLHDLLGEHGDRAGLYEILSERIHHLENDSGGDEQRARLLVERARLRMELGDSRGAGRDLDAALHIDARQPDALYHRGLGLRDEQPERATQLLESFLEVTGDDRRRAEVELALSEVLAGQDDLAGAVVQLDHLVRQTPDDTSVRERLVEYLIRAQEYRRASEELHKLEGLRVEPADKIRDQLRLATLLSEHLDDRNAAAAALERARDIDPLAIEPVRRLLEVDGRDRQPILEQTASALRRAIASAPDKPALYERLAVVANWQGDTVGRAMALQVQAAIGSLPADQREVVAAWTSSLPAALDKAKLGDPLHPTDWEALLDPGDGGPCAELWSFFGSAVAESMPTELPQLGFSRGERVKGRDLEDRYPRVIGLLRAMGSGEPEVYVSASKSGYARALCTSKPMLLLGQDVAEAGKPAQAFLLARTIAFLHRGTGALPDLEDDEVVAWFAAAASVAESKLADDVRARLDSRAVAERSRALAKHLGRRDRKALAANPHQFAAAEPAEWRRAALRTGARAGLVVCADIAAALDMLDLGRGGRSLTDDAGSLSLLSFAVSSQFLQLRRRLGMPDKT